MEQKSFKIFFFNNKGQSCFSTGKIAFLFLFVMLGCRPETPNTFFTLLRPSDTHVRFKNTLKETNQFNIIEYLYFNNGGGVAAGDINNDGLPDLYFTSSQGSNRLYLNEGNFRFKDITKQAGVDGEGNWSTGVTMADVNGDGLLDIYVCCLGNYKGIKGHNLLYINNGNLTFTEESHQYGLDFSGFSTQAAFFDYDLDGDLDMYLTNHSVHSSRTYGPATLRYEFDPLAGDRLFRNVTHNGKTYFLDVTRRVGIYSSQIGYGLAVSIGDVNNDGYPDIYVDNDFHENDYLYINHRDGTFYELLPDMIEHTSRSSMGNDMADFNNDGNLDIVSLDMLPNDEITRKKSGGDDDLELYQLKLDNGYYYQFVRNMLQLNLGDSHFAEIGRFSGIYSTDWSWSPLFCDLDNDGYKDLYITNGIYRRANDLDYIKSLTQKSDRGIPLNDMRNPDNLLYEKMPLNPLVNYVYKNNGDLTFTNEAASWGMNFKSYSNGSCYADLDNDGDLDLVTNNINGDAFIYRNNSELFVKNHFIKFSFKGEGENKFGIGARVTLYEKGKMQMEENYTTRGFESSVPPVLLFGTGKADSIDSVLVQWPGGKTEKLYNLKADQEITLAIKNAGEIPGSGNRTGNEKKYLFSKAKDIPGLVFQHSENRFTDLSRNFLTPYDMSREGPCIAVGDVNNDHRQDIFFGNAKGKPAELLVSGKSGFRKTNDKLFETFAGYEDVAAVFFDADNDGDQDLYVVSGGDEYKDNNPFMQDRLYINDGHGNFSYDKNSLPVFYHNGSCVSPADFDGDGDIDLFVGSRSIPGAYGMPAHSYLLENNGFGHFTDVTREKCPELSSLGMITGACWANVNKDKSPDLILAGEWMPVTVFLNKNGKLLKDERLNGLQQSNGLWFCIKAADLDGDGDMDLIAGNLGLNAGIRADSANPVKLFINDFDNNGTSDPVITWKRNGKDYPIATVDELTRQIGSLKNKFPTYASMAGKTVQEIFSPEKLDSSVIKNIYEFRSGIFINQGDGIFKFSALPAEAQFSTVTQILVDDFDMDGTKDILVAGNLYEVRPSIGRMDASFGWFLKGEIKKEGGLMYRAEWPDQSGLMIRGQAGSLNEFNFGNDKIIVAGLNNAKAEYYSVNIK